MTTELNLIAALSHKLAEPLPVAQKEALQRARSPKLLRWARTQESIESRGFCCWSRV
jgi:hypothetical protein